MPDHETYIGTKYFGSLNGIRALAIIFVIGFHFAYNCRGFGITDFFSAPLFERGYLGVNLFFIVSGFLITTLLLREQQTRQMISIRSFYDRRIRRIFPLYYTVLIGTVLILPLTDSSLALKKEFIDNLPFFATYTSNWFVLNHSAIFAIAWTLATEEQFYLTWPHLLRRLTRPVTILAVIFMVLLNQLALFGQISFLPLLSESANVLLVRILTSISTPICFGALLAFALNSKRIYERLSIFKYKITSTAVLIALSVFIFVPKELTPAIVDVISLFMTLWIASCVYQEKHHFAKILNSKIFFQIGLVSYGMYLFHIHCLYAVRHIFLYLNWKNTDFEFLVSLVVTFLLANASFYFFESRFRLGKAG